MNRFQILFKGQFEWIDAAILLAGVFLFAFAALCMVQLNYIPMERYGSWDLFWGDARFIQGLALLKEALSNFEYPYINRFVNFGWNAAGDITTPSMAIHIFTAPFFSPESMLIIDTLVCLWIACFGTFLYVNKISKSFNLAMSSGMFAATLPILITSYLYNPANRVVFPIPLMIYSLHCLLEEPKQRTFLKFAFAFALSVSIGCFNSLPTYFPICTVYSFLYCWIVRRDKVLPSIGKTVAVVALCFAIGSFYYVPLFGNFFDHYLAMSEFRAFDFVEAKESVSAHLEKYFALVHKYPESFRYPVDGQGLIPYAQGYWWAAAIMALFLPFCNLRFFNSSARIVFVVCSAASFLYLGPVILYQPLLMELFPIIGSTSRGILRYQINALPILVLCAGSVAFSILANKGWKERLIFCAGVAVFSWKSELIGSQLARGYFRPEPSSSFFEVVSQDFLTANGNQSYVQFNIICLLFFFVISVFRLSRSSQRVWVALIGGALSFYSISMINELSTIQGYEYISPTKTITRSTSSRIECLDALGINNVGNFNGRVMYLSRSGNYDRHMDYKFSTDLEILPNLLIPTIPVYRELDLAYFGMLYRNLTGTFSKSNFPVMRLDNLTESTLRAAKFYGVSHIVAVNGQVNCCADQLTLLGECVTDGIPKDSQLWYRQTEWPKSRLGGGGAVFVYALNKPGSILGFAKEVRTLSDFESITKLSMSEIPDSGVVWLENVESFGSPRGDRSDGPNSSNISLVNQTSQSANYLIETQRPGWLTIAYTKRSDWIVEVNGEHVEPLKAFGGFMAVPINSGSSEITISYSSRLFFVGALLATIVVLVVCVVSVV